MPQLQPFFYTQELFSVLGAISLITILMSIYFMPTIMTLHSVRRYLVSL